jgi:RNA polymerase sigma-70 factor (ECF subfamily)
MIFIIIFTDEDIEKLRSRDPQTFEKIFNEFHQKIYNFLIIQTNGDKHTAEEIFSDTFYSALISAHTIKDANKIFAWLLQIAKRRFSDHLRKKYKTKDAETEEEVTDQLHAKDENKEHNEKAVLLNIALDNLKSEYSDILRLKYIEDKSQKELSEIYKKSESSIESLLFRAREALKKEMKKIIKEN